MSKHSKGAGSGVSDRSDGSQRGLARDKDATDTLDDYVERATGKHPDSAQQGRGCTSATANLRRTEALNDGRRVITQIIIQSPEEGKKNTNIKSKKMIISDRSSSMRLGALENAVKTLRADLSRLTRHCGVASTFDPKRSKTVSLESLNQRIIRLEGAEASSDVKKLQMEVDALKKSQIKLVDQLAEIVRDSIRIELAEQDKKFVSKEDLHEAIKDFSKKDDLEVALTSLSELESSVDQLSTRLATALESLPTEVQKNVKAEIKGRVTSLVSKLFE